MNKTGTYVAFDGLGQADPSKSYFRYYSILQAWDANKSMVNCKCKLNTDIIKKHYQ